MDRRVILISFEAADLSLIERGLATGRLPVMSRLLEMGRSVRLVDRFSVLTGTAFTTAITGRSALEHHRILNRQLVPGSYRIRHLDVDEAKYEPFWKLLSEAGVSSTVAGVHTAPQISPFLGTQVIGWGTFDPSATRYQPARSSPPQVVEELNARFGRPNLHTQLQAPVGERGYRRYAETLRRNVPQQEGALAYLMERDNWRFFCGTLAEAHQGGHFLWHLDDEDHPLHAGVADDLRGSLLGLYERVDAGIGMLLRRKRPQDDFFVFTAQGMEANPAVGDMASLVLERAGMLARSPLGVSRRNAPAAIRKIARLVVPKAARRALGRLAPHTWQRMMSESFNGDVDWDATRAFELPTDEGTSLIRINLQGREPRGTVSQARFPDVRREVVDVFESLIDPLSGESAVDEVWMMDDQVSAFHMGPFPDIAVRWRGASVTKVASPRTGEVAVRQPEPQTGRNRGPGFIVGVGEGIEGQRTASFSSEAAQLIDVAPTILHRLGVSSNNLLPGTPIRDLS